MADYSYSPGRSTMSTASSTRLGGNTISKAQSGIRPRGNIATRRSKYVTRSSTGISPAKGGAYSQMFSELIPNVNFNKITCRRNKTG